MKLSSLANGQRNVLLVLLDDLGRDLWYAAPIPNLARLEPSARVYPTFWAGPVCSNFRARLQTGLRSYRRGNLVGRNFPSGADVGWSLPTAAGHLLAQNLPGVSTLRGKWHVANYTDTFHPLQAGYVHWSGSMNGTGTYYDWLKIVDGHETVSHVYATLDVAQEATRDVVRGVNFVLAAFKTPHAPLHAPPSQFHSFGPPWNERKYALAMLEAWDTIAAPLIEAAIARGYVVIVTADNATAPQLGGKKGTLYEAGLRCPLLVAGAGVRPGVSPRLVEAVDLYATIMELRGGSATTPDAFSFARDLFGCCDEPRVVMECDRWETLGELPRPDEWDRAVRDARWKLIALAGTGEEFYDLESDPDEQHDLSKGSLSSEQLEAYHFLRSQLPVP